jgi:hypothetical protein
MRRKGAERMKRTIAVLVGVAGLLAPTLLLAAAAASLSPDEQKRLVMAGLSEARRRLPGLEIRALGPDPQYPRLAEYMVARPAAVLGYFDVDPRTGDVFQATGCGRVSTPGLDRLQQAARARLRLTPGAYARLRVKGPYCG